MGPTASGKTGLAVSLVQHQPLEIISVDSALVYRGMDIGTAKPDAATLMRAPHHLLDIRDPTGTYSAAAFRADALRLMEKITASGKTPLLVGGTMLYFRALLHGLDALPQADSALRAAIEEEAAQHGWPALHKTLARLDPETAARLKPTDAQRIQRALEVIRLTGKPMSSLLKQQQSALPYRVLQLALIPGDRGVLHQRIAQRFDAMLAEGIVDEVRQLRRCYPLSPDMPSMRCVGYRQAWEFIDGGIDEKSLRERGLAATRQLAKRQMTWLRSMPDVEIVDCVRHDLSETVSDRCAAFLKSLAAREFPYSGTEDVYAARRPDNR